MGRCFHGAGPNGLTVCICVGWSPASSKPADYPCAVCGLERGWDWFEGRPVGWNCYRDSERSGQGLQLSSLAQEIVQAKQ